jgi:nudix-type nucleoside diphosphatase (YffH/AdpP family)
MKNSKLRIKGTEVLSDQWYTYKRVSFEREVSPGEWVDQKREVLDRGDGATILLYNKRKKSVILTRQFRLPAFLNKHPTGLLIETCAGSVESESPEENIVRETEEETGYRIQPPQKIFQAYMSPGAVTEIIHFYIAEYEDSMKVSSGGGQMEEQEYIEVLELSFLDAMERLKQGDIQDAKTIMLLQYAQLNHLF